MKNDFKEGDRVIINNPGGAANSLRDHKRLAGIINRVNPDAETYTVRLDLDNCLYNFNDYRVELEDKTIKDDRYLF